MDKLLKFFGLAFVASVFIVFPVIPMLGATAGVLYMAFRGPLAERRRSREAAREAARVRAVRSRRFHDRKRGWMVEELPAGMTAQLDRATDRSLPISMFGLDGFARAERRGEDVRFSFTVEDASRRRKIARRIDSEGLPAEVRTLRQPARRLVSPLLPDADAAEDAARDFRIAGLTPVTKAYRDGTCRVVSEPVGLSEKERLDSASAYLARRYDIDERRAVKTTWKVIADEPAVLSSLGAGAASRRTAEAAREVHEVREYVVPDCASYEEALEKFKATRDSLTAANTYLKVSVSVDGNSSERKSGESLAGSLTELAAGAFVISEDVVSRQKGRVSVPLGMTDAGELSALAEERLSDAPCTVDPAAVMSDVTPRDVRRYLLDREGRRLDLRPLDAKALEGDALRVFIAFDSAEQMREFAQGGVVPQGTFVTVSRVAPDARFVASMPLTEVGRLMNAVDMGRVDGDLAARARIAGASVSDVAFSRLLSSVEQTGYAVAAVNNDLSLSDFSVGGVSLQEVSDRLDNPRLGPVDDASMEAWIEDASHIESVSMVIDPLKMEMRITTCVDGVQKSETAPITKEQLQQLQGRNNINEAELKNLVMETHPDYFNSYRAPQFSAHAPVKSVSANAIDNFIKGLPVEKRRPVPKPRPAQQAVKASVKAVPPKLRPGK